MTGPRARRTWAARARRWVEGPRDFDGLFPPHLRSLGVIYVLVSVPALVGVSALLAGHVSYLLMFTVIPTAAYLVPCFVVVRSALRRAPTTAQDRPAYLLWLCGTITVCIVVLGILVGLVTGWRVANPAGVPAVLAISVLLNGGSVRLTRSRSGQRALSVDMVEAAMAVIVITAPGVLLWGDSILSADAAWFTVPAALATVGMIFGIYWGLALVVRLGPNAGPLEVYGLCVPVVGAANTAAQVTMGVSGFTLPVAPFLALHLVCASLLFLVPVYLPWSRPPGLDRLPPQAQVRARSLATSVTLAGLPALLVTAMLVDDRTSWALPFTIAVLGGLVGLAGLRQLAGVHETRRLYTQVEQAAEQRHRLLTQIVRRVDEDRHRVARDLYEQSVFAYSSVASLFGTYEEAGTGAAPLAWATKVVRDDLADRAASRRSLMLATRPLRREVEGGSGGALTALVQAYLDTLYDSLPPPRLTVTTSPDLELDWPTETVVLRIAEEALSNVRHHSRAREVHVTVDGENATTTLSIGDDGVGFDPVDQAPGTGIPAMQAFAAVLGGSVHVDSAPGAGTTVIAHLGGDRPVDEQPHLHPVP